MTTGISSRLSYDTTAYDADVQQSTNPLGYYVSPDYYANCEKCAPEVGQAYPTNFRRTSEPRIDIENTLTSRTWKRDKRQTNGEKWDDFEDLKIKYENFETLRDCGPDNTAQHSLLQEPKLNYRSMSTDHLVFTSLPINPQDYIPDIRQPGASSRDIAINQYRQLTKNR